MFFPIANTTAQNLQIVVALAVPFVSLAVASVAVWAIRAQRESSARRIYFDYVKIAFDHPEYAYPLNAEMVFDHKLKTVDGSGVLYEKYEWFISLLVVSVEGILEISGKRSVWRASAIAQLSYHRDFFTGNLEKPWLKTKILTFHEILKLYASNAPRSLNA